ncbi:hypothetical protein SPRG_17367, partial [Saprolegnia parasitica CBS 223.65]
TFAFHTDRQTRLSLYIPIVNQGFRSSYRSSTRLSLFIPIANQALARQVRTMAQGVRTVLARSTSSSRKCVSCPYLIRSSPRAAATTKQPVRTGSKGVLLHCSDTDEIQASQRVRDRIKSLTIILQGAVRRDHAILAPHNGDASPPPSVARAHSRKTTTRNRFM